MRAKERQQGRFVSLSGLRKERGRPGDRYEVKILDRDGCPISHLMEWFRLRKTPGSDRTRRTYLDLLLPFVGFQIRHEYAWNVEPKQVRSQVTEFLRDGLACTIRPDWEGEGVRWEPSAASPLSESGIRGFLAAANDFYETMIEAGYYPFSNPLRSEVLTRLKREWLQTVENAGAPDHAGIRSLSWAESRSFSTAFFRQKNTTAWKPSLPLLKEQAQQRLCEAIHFMIEHTDSQRDKVLLLLLYYTGARPHEILALTAGGCRKGNDPCRAVVVSKRSQGRETKTIHFTSLVERELRAYIRTERAAHDPLRRKRLEELEDCTPIFLTEQGNAYTYGAFRYHWRKLYALASKHYHITFRLYDIRHLFVTRYIQLAKQEAAGDEVKLAELKEGLQLLMAWRSPLTMKAYDHSFREAEGLAHLALMHQGIDQNLARPMRRAQAGEIAQPKASPPPSSSSPGLLMENDDEELLAWVADHLPPSTKEAR